MPELDQRALWRLAEAIHHVRGRTCGHEQRSPDLEQRRALDALHETPEMSVVATEVAIPAAARVCLDDHRQRGAVARLVEPSDLRDERLERLLDGRADVDVFRDGEGLNFQGRCCGAHCFSSACALMRRSCPRQCWANIPLQS